MKRNSAMLEPRERIWQLRGHVGASVALRVMAVVLVCLMAVAGAGALEPDELRPGMDPDAVASVYTSLRSCSNSAFLEEPDFIAWDASLFNRSARIEARFDKGLASVIVIRIFLESGDDGADILRELTDEHTRRSGPPQTGADGRMRWFSATLIVELAVERIQGRSELRLVMSAAAS
ncbi:MAG: hypothetical protein A2Y38_13150 [Spirochaetes bacterium GWB1_59_5]|nr:MAG: hypothetical protein A2Y38_13150 [Spirochaetes bacterium GWB1_59_5]